MTGVRGSASFPAQAEALLEELRRPADAVARKAPRGERARDREPVEPATDAGDGGGICVPQVDTAAARCGALEEELHRRKLPDVRGVQGRVRRRALERREPIDVLAF